MLHRIFTCSELVISLLFFSGLKIMICIVVLKNVIILFTECSLRRSLESDKHVSVRKTCQALFGSTEIVCCLRQVLECPGEPGMLPSRSPWALQSRIPEACPHTEGPRPRFLAKGSAGPRAWLSCPTSVTQTTHAVPQRRSG